MMYKTYDDFYIEIDLLEFAIHHGYIIDRAAGIHGWSELNHPSDDRTIIINPQHKMYKERDYGVMRNFQTFIKDRSQTVFAKFATAENRHNLDRLLNDVCNDFLQISPAQKSAIKNHIPENFYEHKQKEVFDISKIKISELENPFYLVKIRGIEPSVLKDPLFKGKLVNQHQQLKNGDTLTNTGFLYTDQLNGNVTGIELRNSNFSRHAECSDRSKSIGISNIPEVVKYIILTESFIDSLSHYQLYPRKESLYISAGGALGGGQINTVFSIAEDLKKQGKLGPDFKFVLAFDNDIPGCSYDLQFIRHLGAGDGGQPLPINKQSLSSVNHISIDVFNTSDTEKFMPKVKAFFNGANSEGFGPFRLEEGQNGSVNIQFEKDPKVFAQFNTIMANAAGIKNFAIHKAKLKDFNDDVKQIQSEKKKPIVKLDFSKIDSSRPKL